MIDIDELVERQTIDRLAHKVSRLHSSLEFIDFPVAFSPLDGIETRSCLEFIDLSCYIVFHSKRGGDSQVHLCVSGCIDNMYHRIPCWCVAMVCPPLVENLQNPFRFRLNGHHKSQSSW